MIEEILSSSLDVLVIALCINVATAIVKLPIKRLAKKLKEGNKLTRFITFLPIIFGYAFTTIFRCATGAEVFGNGFVEAWLSASSLSLAVYAVFEKFFPSAEKTLTAEEISEIRTVINQISVAAKPDVSIDGKEAPAETATENAPDGTAPNGSVAETTSLTADGESPSEEKPE